MKTLLLLSSSLLVNKPLLKKDNIKIEYGKKRINSYQLGFNALLEKQIFKKFENVLFCDNTLSNTKDINKNIKRLLPANILFSLEKNNYLGRKNKGAGMVEILKNNIQIIEKFELVFYFEPRLVLFSDQFIKNFLSEKQNYFSLESKKSVKTGYFGSTSFDLIQFLNSVSVHEMIEKNLFIEILMFEFYKKLNTNFVDYSSTYWKNYLSELYEKY